jgi:hypothetical protein
VCGAGLARELAAGENTCGTIISEIMVPQVFFLSTNEVFVKNGTKINS